MNQELKKLSLFIVISVLSLLPSFIWLRSAEIPDYVLHEGGIVETVAALSCFIASVIFFLTASRKFGQPKLNCFWMYFFALACIFLAGEEVSWGQHIFNFEVNENFANNNFQGELNIHNSQSIQGANNLISNVLFNLLIVYLLIFPMLVAVFQKIYSHLQWLSVPVPSLLIALVVLVAIMSRYMNFKVVYGVSFNEDIHRLGEMTESIVEFCLLILAFECLSKVKSAL